MTVLALLGAKALYLTYLWLAAAILGAYLSGRKGYGERPGLASGLLLNFVGPIIWLFVPARKESMWATVGPWGTVPKAEKLRKQTEAAALPAGKDDDGSAG